MYQSKCTPQFYVQYVNQFFLLINVSCVLIFGNMWAMQQRVTVYTLTFALMSQSWKPILSNYFRILQSHGLLSRTVISNLSTIQTSSKWPTITLQFPEAQWEIQLQCWHKSTNTCNNVKLCRGTWSLPNAEPFPAFVSTNQQIKEQIHNF